MRVAEQWATPPQQLPSQSNQSPDRKENRLEPFTETRGQRSNRKAENSRDKAQERIVSFILSQKECWPTGTMKCRRRKWRKEEGAGENRPQCEEGLAVALYFNY